VILDKFLICTPQSFPPDRLIVPHLTENCYEVNIHTPAALYETFEAKEARRILKKLEFHYTPKHGSWLNQVEIELSVLSRQCLERRIPDQGILKQEIAAWEESRNQARATVAWRFTTTDARVKLQRLYPSK
jgi:hypothetical protein